MRRKLIILILLFVLMIPFVFNGCELGETEKPCVVMIGDSIFALNDHEADALEELSGATYRKYYQTGAQMIGGNTKTIPEQYAEAIADGNIRTLILDGGGTDILINAKSRCSTIYGEALCFSCYDVMEEVVAEIENLFEKAVNDGVENIIYQGYYYFRDGLLWQATDDFQDMIVKMICKMSLRYPKVKFVYVDPRKHFTQCNLSYLLFDGIHPTQDASVALANLIWDAMGKNRIEQWEPCR